MAEQLDLTSPDIVTTPNWVVTRLLLDWGGGAMLIVLRGPNGKERHLRYADNPDAGSTVATILLRQLNKADLSVKSLQRRILERLQADYGDLAGTILGLPD